MALIKSNPIMLPLILLASERAGATPSQALPLAFLGASMNQPLIGLMIALSIARSEAPGNLPVAPQGQIAGAGAVAGAVAGAGAGGVGAQGVVAVVPNAKGPQPVAGAQQLLQNFGMPSFHGLRHRQAAEYAALLGVVIVGEHERDENAIVIRQEPGIGDDPKDNTIELTYGHLRR